MQSNFYVSLSGQVAFINQNTKAVLGFGTITGNVANDSITVMGTLPVPSGLSLTNQQVVLDVNGVAKAFTLNSKGQAGSGNSTFKLMVPKGKKTGTFTMKLNKGTFATTLASVLPNENDTKKSVTLAITILFNKSIFTHNQKVSYTAKKGNMGMAK